MSWSADIRARLGEFALDVTLEVDASVLAIVGPNGSGKTTFLRALAGAIDGLEGKIEIADRVVFESASDTDVAIEERRIAYVPQGYGLFGHLTVLENVSFGLRFAGLESGAREEQARRMLERMQITKLAERRIDRLSGGEKQRVVLARALVLEPAMLLLDEPLGALDATSRRRMRTYLAEELAGLNCPTVMVTHDVRDLDGLDAEIVVFGEGSVVQRGCIDELRAEPANDFVVEFLG